MDKTQAENLRILIRHMDVLPRILDMNRFSQCGTPACALGEACTLTALNARGLVRGPEDEEWGFLPLFRNDDDCRGQRFFGIHSGDGARLFGTTSENAWARDAVTPQEWAVEARKVLAENGYSMDEPKPAQTFQSFMAKALERIPPQFVSTPDGDVLRIELPERY